MTRRRAQDAAAEGIALALLGIHAPAAQAQGLAGRLAVEAIAAASANARSDWMFEMYQLQLRYVSATRVPFRVDAGIIPSPVGLFTLELQPHTAIR